MKRKMKALGYLPLIVLLAGSLLSGCQSNSISGKGGVSEPSAKAPSNEPVTLNFYAKQNIPDDKFNATFVEPLKKKYPNITLNKITNKTTIDALIASNELPDIIYTFSGDLASFESVDLWMDQTPLIKAHNIDLNRFDPIVLQAGKYDQGLLALPFLVNFNALYYNKDIFDKFGVPYPKDGMTWDETVALARKLTIMDQGVQFRGLDPDGVYKMSLTKSLTTLDFKTGKAALGTPDWLKVLGLLKDIYTISGNKPEKFNYSTDPFIKNKVAAMLATAGYLKTMAETEGLNWDIAQYPSYPETRNTYGSVDSHLMWVTPTSKHKDEAIEVLKLATSDEVQMILTKDYGDLTPLNSMEIKKTLGQSFPQTKEKHIESIYKSKNAPPQRLTKYEAGARDIFMKNFPDYISGKLDLNTFVRTSEEAVNQYLETVKK
jgi:ABC-type glycerol-3-phosphate transport system substrate-binding protein